MMANIGSFGLYLLAMFLSGVNHSLALPNNAAENIPHGAETEQISQIDRLELAIQTMMRAVEDGFARSARERREIKEEVGSLKEEMTTLKEGMKSLEDKLNVSSSCVEGQTPSTGDLDPATSDLQCASEASLAAEKRLKAEIGQAVDTFTSSVSGQKLGNTTACPTESDPTPHAVPPSRNCYDMKQRGHSSSGVYSVTIAGKQVQVYCDMESDGGGWTVVQRRDDIEPHVDFNREWDGYKRGFGDLNGEFWLGLDNIHGLTTSTPMRLRVDLEDWEGEKRVALYHTFMVQDEEEKYNLTVGGYKKGSGGDDPGNALYWHNGKVFSTKDQDNDGYGVNCAEMYKGGWWYITCLSSNLNGVYLKGRHDQSGQGVHWYYWKGSYYSLRRTAMKIRPR